MIDDVTSESSGTPQIKKVYYVDLSGVVYRENPYLNKNSYEADEKKLEIRELQDFIESIIFTK